MSTVAVNGMPTRGLLRILGLAFGVATVVGGVVGMGIPFRAGSSRPASRNSGTGCCDGCTGMSDPGTRRYIRAERIALKGGLILLTRQPGGAALPPGAYRQLLR
jgi:hypothetical protein